MAVTTDQLVAVLNASGGTDPWTTQRVQAITHGGDSSLWGVGGGSGGGFINGALNGGDPYGGLQSTFNRGATPTYVNPSGGAVNGGLLPGGAGALNVPYGSDYFSSVLDAYLRMLTLGQQRQQFQTTAQMAGAEALARLFAAGPQSAAELAFSQAGRGMPAFGGGAVPIEDIIRSATFGAGAAPGVLDFNGQQISVPATIGGAALERLRGNPNAAGVIQSFARPAGNPDIIQRSIASLLPAGFRPPAAVPGMGF